MFVELNIDALVGPTHHFGGVGVGNVASLAHTHQPSFPRAGALEGLRKARLVAELGVPQYVLPPVRRPLPHLLTSLGFTGEFTTQCAQARAAAPAAYSAVFSSASMWAANAATVAPACDCSDGRTHLTLANLSSSWHRWFEHADRQRQLEHMFAGSQAPGVVIHSALPPVMPLRDEGAANHMRLCNATGDIGFHVFVYGESDLAPRPARHVPRQTLAACQAIARLHGLDPKRTFYLQQHPDAIDAGVFHNDVIATSHRDMLIMHELAFIDAEGELSRLADAFQRATKSKLNVVRISREQLSLSEAVSSYLFNSQLLTPEDDRDAMILVCAEQCQRSPGACAVIESLIAARDNPLREVRYVSLDQSMSGGGGPACLRLRLSLPRKELKHFAPSCRLTPELADRLQAAIQQTYPERLDWGSLAEPENMRQYELAYAALESIF